MKNEALCGVLALWLLLTVLDAAPFEVLLIAYEPLRVTVWLPVKSPGSPRATGLRVQDGPPAVP